MENDKLASLPAMAEILKLPERWIKDEADAGRIPHIKVGNRYRFNRETVVALLAERAARGDSRYWVAALALAIRDGDKGRADLARAELRRLGTPLTTAARLKPKGESDGR
jgi:excisionase family DNA binding protein